MSSVNPLPIQYSEINSRLSAVNSLPKEVSEAEIAILGASKRALDNYKKALETYQRQLNLVEEKQLSKPEFQIRGSAGIVIYNQKGQVLLAQVHKPDHRTHHTYTTLSGRIRPLDFELENVPVSVAVAARQGEEESHGVLNHEVLIKRILQNEATLLPSTGMANSESNSWVGPVFALPVAGNPETIVSQMNDAAFKANAKKQEETIHFEWVDLSKILEQHEAVEKAYKKKVEELGNADLTEKKENKDLKSIYDSIIEVETEHGKVKIGDAARRTFACSRSIFENLLKKS